MQKENLPATTFSKDLKTSGHPKPWPNDDKHNLAAAIAKVFNLQKQFGKTTEQLENMIEGFCWALEDYLPQDVIRGFGVYIKTHNDMPTPFDIRQIIDPIEPEWRPDREYYAKLRELVKAEGPFALNNQEIEYIGKYEEHMRRGMHQKT